MKAAEPGAATGVLPTRHDDGAPSEARRPLEPPPAPDRPRRKSLPVRAMGADDVAAVTRLRLALLRETGASADDGLAAQALCPATEAFFRRSLSSADWQTWVAVAPFDEAVVAIGSLALWHRPPYPGNPAGLDAYLLNMYTAPTHRGQGAARGIAEAALAWARQRGVPKLVLHATPAGRVLYQTLGFTPSTAYMELSLGPLA